VLGRILGGSICPSQTTRRRVSNKLSLDPIDRNQDGLIVSQKFQFVGPDTQDEVCEKYRKRLHWKIRETAECITGTELPVKPY
jgi:hypothetical protein